jgi:anti-sigma B factor antagonist
MMVELAPGKRSLQDGRFSIQLEGPVDMKTVPEIRRMLLGTAKKREVTEIRVDFSRVTALDTAGVAMLVEIWRGLARKDGVLRLSGLSEKARRLMQLARLDQVFAIGDDLERGF